MRKAILAVLLAVGLAASLFSPVHAAGTRASIISDGLRVDVTFTGKKPSKATLVVGGASYKLKRSGRTWTTKQLTAAQIAALVGQKARVKITVGGKKRTVRGTVGGGGTTPTTPTPTTPPPSSARFAAPGVDRSGEDAWKAISGYVLNSTLTDCPAGWPNCPVETRYGFRDNGVPFYCLLTSLPGADVRAENLNLTQTIGISQYADGSWAVSFRTANDTTYTVAVSATGMGQVSYWGPGVDPATSSPTSIDTNLVWMQGAQGCSY